MTKIPAASPSGTHRTWGSCLPASVRSTGLLLALTAFLSCTGSEEERSGAASGGTGSEETGRPEIVEALREDLQTRRHPSDGGGSATVTQEMPADRPVRAGEAGRWRIEYVVGPEGISEGGWIFLQVSPFWGWSTPQTVRPDAPGFTLVETEADGVELQATTLDQQLLGIEVLKRPLAPNDRVTMIFGAGSFGAIADRYAESASHLWIAVDGDGDGVRKTLLDSPSVPVAAAAASRLVVTLPTTGRVGEPLRMTVAALDRAGNAGNPIDGSVSLELGPGLSGPSTLAGGTTSLGARAAKLVPTEEGVFRIRASTEDGLSGISNPISISSGPRILWGDLHGHSAFSDGTGTPKDYFRYARDVAGIDVIALTDHDHWGMLALASYPHLWEEIRRETELFHKPGEFVTLLGYEWTNWQYGHRHVLYFEDSGEIYDSIDTEYEHPEQLWDALRGRPALTFAHHSAGGPVPIDWSIAPDPELEPLTEITSVHGSSEALDSPGLIYNPKPGNFVRDVLDRGYRFGLIGSGDSHDGHPGLAHYASPTGGLAAIITEDATREGVLQALKSRRVYATNGPRILMRVTLDGAPMGSALEAPEDTIQLRGYLVGEDLFERLEIIRSGEIRSLPIDPAPSISFDHPLEALEAGEYVYVRAVQSDGGTAWSSPFFIE